VLTPGATLLTLVAIGNVALWIVARPPNQPTSRYVGEICGAEAVLLLSCTLVLSTVLPAIERAFSGLDRVVVWHRRAATVGVLLLLPHVVLATSSPDRYATGFGPGLGDVALLGLLVLSVWALAPKLRAARWPGPIRRLARASYERWLTAHRLTGLFVIAAVPHGALVDPAVHDSTLLRVVYLTVGGVGIAAYIYRELFARFVVPVYNYTVADVRRPNDATLEISLEPVRDPPLFVPGQFVFLAFGGVGGWQRHPFSIASAPAERRLEVAIKAVGDLTRDLHDRLRPGTPARAAGPFGGFDYRRGGHDQIWIAGGIGITPFMSWIRGFEATFDRHVDFYYSVAREADALYLDEIDAAGAQHPTFHPHVVYADRDGRLTAQRVAGGRPRGADVWVYLCGPPPMTAALAKVSVGSGFRPAACAGSSSTLAEEAFAGFCDQSAQPPMAQERSGASIGTAWPRISWWLEPEAAEHAASATPGPADLCVTSPVAGGARRRCWRQAAAGSSPSRSRSHRWVQKLGRHAATW
jgi:predicted ferric reductase